MDARDELIARLRDIAGPAHVRAGDEITDELTHDESLTAARHRPVAVVSPADTAQVSAVLALASDRRVPVTARGSGTGLSGAANPVTDGIVVSFERMDTILEIDLANNVAVVQPGVRLDQLDAVVASYDLVYPVFPGEYSASLGGNVATNAGGMRAVKYGVTRHQVLGLEVVLPDGEVIRTGGKFVKSTSGYDLTQLVIGSEGTLALVTEVIIRLYPRAPHQATVLAPFVTLDDVTAAVPEVVASGIDPLVLEYIDILTMTATTDRFGLELGVADEIKQTAYAYLVIMVEDTHLDDLGRDVEALGALLTSLGAMDVYVLPAAAAGQLIDAREKAFWLAKANNADDVLDMVVPRASIPQLMHAVSELATRYGAWIAGCGHAGDGNVHLGVFLADDEAREALLHDLFEAALGLGGAISGEHGIGTAKRHHFLALEDPTKLALMRRIKAAFDPHGIMNPGTLLDPEVVP